MGTTTFVDRQTPIMASWLNDVDALVYDSGLSVDTTNNVVNFDLPFSFTDTTFTDRRAVIQARRELTNPVSVDSLLNLIHIGSADNASVRGVAGAFLQVRDGANTTTATRGCLYGMQVTVVPRFPRNNTPYDDVACLVLGNATGVVGAKATDCIYLEHNNFGAFGTNDAEWTTGITNASNNGYNYRAIGAYFTAFDYAGRMTASGGGGYGFVCQPTIQADMAAGNAYMFRSVGKTTAASFNLANLFHYIATVGSIGVGSSITSQYGFFAASALAGATNNYGFYSDMGKASGTFGFFAAGSAYNSFEGNTGIGTTTLDGRKFAVGGAQTGATTAYAILAGGEVKSDVTASFNAFATSVTTEDVPFSLASIKHYSAVQGTISGGSRTTPTSQYGFSADASLIGATNNYGFLSEIPKQAGTWNFYASGTAPNLFAGSLVVGTAQLANNATDGFIYVPGTTSGAPTGVPTTYSGTHAMVVDDTNMRLYIYIPGTGWKYTTLT